jgi:hypothetical protein
MCRVNGLEKLYPLSEPFYLGPTKAIPTFYVQKNILFPSLQLRKRSKLKTFFLLVHKKPMTIIHEVISKREFFKKKIIYIYIYILGTRNS